MAAAATGVTAVGAGMQFLAGGGDTRVRNTFIEMMPETPQATPLPSPMASAPARSYFSLKASLAEAAEAAEAFDHGGEAAERDCEDARAKLAQLAGEVRRRSKEDESSPVGSLPEVGVNSSVAGGLSASTLEAHVNRSRGRLGRLGRPKPDPLKFCSTNSMMSIPESPIEITTSMNATYAMGEVISDPAKYISGSATASSIPPTPMGLCDYVSTPTGTPAARLCSGHLLTAEAAEARMAGYALGLASGADVIGDRKTTLSLVDMIQSPKGQTTVPMQQSAFNQAQLYMPPAAPAVAPGVLPASNPPPPPQYQPSVQTPRLLTMPQESPPPPGPPGAAAPPGHGIPRAAFGVGAGGAGGARQPTSPAAAVKLGLVSLQRPNHLIPTSEHMAVGTLQTGQAQAAMATGQVAQATAASGAMPAGQAAGMGLPPPPPLAAAPQVFSTDSPTRCRAGSGSGAQVQPTVFPPQFNSLGQPPGGTTTQPQPAQGTGSGTVLAGGQPRVPCSLPPAALPRAVPPPPLAPAPTAGFSPQAPRLGPPAPANMESDIKVLLDLAVSSGNQQAVDALLRQAQHAGMSPDQLRGLVEQNQTNNNSLASR